MPRDSVTYHAGRRASAGAWRRRSLCGVAALLLALAAWHVAGIQGLIVPVRVSESSMVPALLAHTPLSAVLFVSEVFRSKIFDASAADLRTICPRCATLHRLTAPIAVRRGDRVLINQWERYRPEDLRWQTVAVRNPANRADWLVKRIVGLPGERLELRNGDVYVDGKLQAKSLADFRQLALPVLDTLGTPAGQSRVAWTRWQPRSNARAWRLESAGYVSDATADGDWSWLAFQGCDLPGRHLPGVLLVDDYPFNQTLSRRLFPVRDLLLRCEVRAFRQGQVACRVSLGGQRARVVWDVDARRVTLDFNGETRLERHLPRAHVARRVGLELAVCDGQLQFALNRQLVLRAALPPQFLQTDQGVEALELGTRRGSLTVSRIELLRDVYYLTRPASALVPPPAARALAADEFFVLGDNSPVSEDSRDFGPIHRTDVLGRLMSWRARRTLADDRANAGRGRCHRTARGPLNRPPQPLVDVC